MGNVFKNANEINSDIETFNTKLIAVTKYVSVDSLIEAYEAGIRDFAESKVKDAQLKLDQLSLDIVKNSTWHFIGHLQTNKVKKVVGVFDYIHSIDSLKLAQAVSVHSKEKGIVQKVLLQVNNAEEETKFGLSLEETKELFREIISLDSLKVVGLMNMAPYTADKELLHKLFGEIRELRDFLQEKYNYDLPELSMGMSNDYKIAAEEGSTMIRIGTNLFK